MSHDQYGNSGPAKPDDGQSDQTSAESSYPTTQSRSVPYTPNSQQSGVGHQQDHEAGMAYPGSQSSASYPDQPYAGGQPANYPDQQHYPNAQPSANYPDQQHYAASQSSANHQDVYGGQNYAQAGGYGQGGYDPQYGQQSYGNQGYVPQGGQDQHYGSQGYGSQAYGAQTGYDHQQPGQQGYPTQAYSQQSAYEHQFAQPDFGHKDGGYEAGPGWAPQSANYPPAPTVTKSQDANPMKALFDMSFQQYATPGLVKIFYIIGIVLGVLWWLGGAISVALVPSDTTGAGNPALAFVFLIFGLIPLFFWVVGLRIGLEYALAVVRTNQDSRAILAKMESAKDETN